MRLSESKANSFAFAEREHLRDQLLTGCKVTQNTRNYFDNNFGFSFTFYRIVSFNNLLELCSSSLTFGNVNELPFLSLNRDLLPIDDV